MSCITAQTGSDRFASSGPGTAPRGSVKSIEESFEEAGKFGGVGAVACISAGQDGGDGEPASGSVIIEPTDDGGRESPDNDDEAGRENAVALCGGEPKLPDGGTPKANGLPSGCMLGGDVIMAGDPNMGLKRDGALEERESDGPPRPSPIVRFGGSSRVRCCLAFVGEVGDNAIGRRPETAFAQARVAAREGGGGDDIGDFIGEPNGV